MPDKEHAPKGVPYGVCPTCYRPGVTRENAPNGRDTCQEGHVYASSTALMPKGWVPPPVAAAPRQRLAPVAPPVVLPPVALPLPPSSQVPNVNLTPEQEKAVALILSGYAFVFIAVRPTKEQADGSYVQCPQAEATGSDFLTCISGDKDTLMGAKDALPGVIDRLYAKRGLL